MSLALLAIALGLAACGGGESDEDKIVNAIETAATSTDPAVCKETQTLNFMEQTNGGAGVESEKTCEEEAKAGENNPDSVKVSKVDVEGEEASADVAFAGGSFDGQIVKVSLLEEDGRWKLDEMVRFVKFDADKMIHALAESLEEDPKVKPDVVACVVEGLEEASWELEVMVIENDTRPVVAREESCE